MSKLNHYGYRGRRLFKQAKIYEYQLNVMLSQKDDNYGIFIEKTIKTIRKRIADLYRRSDECRAYNKELYITMLKTRS